MVGSSNRITESFGAVLLSEDLSVVESEVIREINWSDFLSDGCDQLFLEHVLYVVDGFRVRLANANDVQKGHYQMSSVLSD